MKPFHLQKDNIERNMIYSIKNIIYDIEESFDNLDNLNLVYDKESDWLWCKYFYSTKKEFENLTYKLSPYVKEKACNIYKKVKIMLSNGYSKEMKYKLEIVEMMFDLICKK